jgi:hypothetical protein
MTNFIDRMANWCDQHPNESLGEWYTRALIAILWASCGAGFVLGVGLGVMVRL